MTKKLKFYIINSAVLAILFSLLTAGVKLIDIQPIGPLDSRVGFATLNGAVRDSVGFSETIYDLTEILGLLPFLAVGGFAVLGLVQLIKRKSIKKVDKDIFLLAAFYVAVLAVYCLFEIVVINRRPVLMDGELEASYPSSHTILAVCILTTAAHQIYVRLSANKAVQIVSVSVCGLITVATVIGRLLSGVHWFTDIIAGLLISGALVFAYLALYEGIFKKEIE